MILIIDNFDSFTYNLVDYFNQLDLEVKVLRNNAPDKDLLNERYEAVVLSPGPGVPASAGKLMKIMDFYHDKKPILGICLGYQAIGKFFGGSLKKAQKPMHGKTSVVFNNGDEIFNNLPTSFEVTRYHSLICHNLYDEILIISLSKEEEVMAIRHKEYPIYGLQFHPEAVLTQHGLDILRNWKNINSLSN